MFLAKQIKEVERLAVEENNLMDIQLNKAESEQNGVYPRWIVGWDFAGPNLGNMLRNEVVRLKENHST